MKRALAFVLVCLISTALAACGPTEKTGSSNSGKGESHTNTPASENESGLSGATRLRTDTRTEQGLYYLTIRDKTAVENGPYYYLVQYMDESTGETMTLCNKPNCKHKDDTCPAFIDVTSNLNIGLPFLFIYNNQLYMFNQDGHLLVSALDGTGRKAAATLPDKYTYGPGYLQDGFLYLDAHFLVASESETDFGNRGALLRIDLTDGNCKELFAYSTISDTLLGISEDRAIYLRKEETPVSEPKNQTEFDAIYNGLKTMVFTRALDGGQEEILFETSSGEADPICMIGGSLYIHSRKDSRLFQFDPRTKEKKTLLEGLEGYISISVDRLYDGRLLYQKNNASTFAYETPVPKNETYALRLDTLESQKIEFSPKGATRDFSGFVAQTSGYYVIWVGEETVEYTRPGAASPDMVSKAVCWRIPRDAFWRGDDTHEVVNWDGFLQ